VNEPQAVESDAVKVAAESQAMIAARPSRQEPGIIMLACRCPTCDIICVTLHRACRTCLSTRQGATPGSPWWPVS